MAWTSRKPLAASAALAAACFVATILAATTLAAGDLRGTPQALDGDTLLLQGERLRLDGVDAPDLEQRCWRGSRLYDCGAVARTALLDLMAGAEVICRPLGPGPGETTLARCTADGYDLSEGMAYTGWAMTLDLAPPRYRAVEVGAREAGRGLWRGRFVAPWAWRAGERLPEETE